MLKLQLVAGLIVMLLTFEEQSPRVMFHDSVLVTTSWHWLKVVTWPQDLVKRDGNRCDARTDSRRRLSA